VRRGKAKRSLGFLLAPVDLVIFHLAFWIAFYLRLGLRIPAANLKAYLQVAPWISLAFFLLLAAFDLYAQRRRDAVSVVSSVLVVVAAMSVVTMALSFWLRGFAFPRGVLILGALLQFVLLSAWRLLCWALERRIHGVKRVMVVGSIDGGRDLLQKFIDAPPGWLKPSLFFLPDDLEVIASNLQQVDALLLAPTIPDERKVNIAQLCYEAGCELFLVPSIYDMLVFKSRVGQIDDLPILEARPVGLTWDQQLIKRAFDFLLSLVLLPVIIFLGVFIAVLIKLTSSGSVLYRQKRVGQGGKEFYLYKFRTMVPDAERLTGPVLATANDPRVTPLGQILRATRLDELPQFYNILKGEMSLVGPRPERPSFVAEFLASCPEYRFRLMIKPGVTGLAQVMGKYSTDVVDKLRYDLFYISHYSFIMDMRILLHTLVMLMRPGAAAGRSDPSEEAEALLHQLLGERETAVGSVDNWATRMEPK